MGDKSLKGHLACCNEVDKPRDFNVRRDAATMGTLQDFFEVQWECVNGGVIARAGDSYENRAAVRVCQVVSKFDDAGIACGIDDDIRSGFSNDLKDFRWEGWSLLR